MSSPLAVIISDLHFNLQNLEAASIALRHAYSTADMLQVPLIIAGDLHDTKANMRAEVVNELVDIFRAFAWPTYTLVGNHDLVNERGDENSLNFLSMYTDVIKSPIEIDLWNVERTSLYFYPYTRSTLELKLALDNIPTGSILIMHQGFLGAQMGDYIQDSTSIDPNILKDYIVISGHYHRHQTIGPITYVGSPYTITFGEANDGPKGYLILNSDGTFTREILDLRKHIIKDIRIEDINSNLSDNVKHGDLVWVKVRGKYSELQTLNKKIIAEYLGVSNFKLDLIPNEVENKDKIKYDLMRDEEILDSLIDQIEDTDQHKSYLKEVWRETFKRTGT